MGINEKIAEPPLSEEFEFSLIGGGKAYGECIVLHLGEGNWGIIDNCVNPKTRKPLSLEYLKKINVPFGNVKFILCTHWHQDHITNITSVFKSCSNAEFYISSALNCEEFLRLLDFKGSIRSNFNPAREFIKLAEYSKDSGRKLIRVNQDQLIFSGKIAQKTITCHTLTPTEETKELFEQSLRNLLQNLEPGISDIVSKPEPNLQSVVSFISIENEFNVLLGGDLELSPKNNVGWQGVLSSKVLIGKSLSSIFKVPHHGSENGFDNKIWAKIIKTKSSLLATTPMLKGKNTLLPAANMIVNMCDFSKENYLTSNPYKFKEGKYKPKIQKIINTLGYKNKKIGYELGQIRFRKNFEDDSDIRVEIFGEALKINCNKLRYYFVIKSADEIDFVKEQVIKDVLQLICNNSASEFEFIENYGNYVLIKILVSIECAIENIIKELTDKCKFTDKEYFCTNVEKPTNELIEKWINGELE